MRIQEIYEKYQIMPQLVTHMLRVAGVGIKILEGWSDEIDQGLVTKALLLHDMGNLVKFDLSKNLMPIENIEKWKILQSEWREKYGSDAYQATMKIMDELGEKEVATILEEEHAGYYAGDTGLIIKQSWPAKILAYADMRVTPAGVVPLVERIADLHSRYGGEIAWYGFLYELEVDIKRMTITDLAAITEKEILPSIDNLLKLVI